MIALSSRDDHTTTDKQPEPEAIESESVLISINGAGEKVEIFKEEPGLLSTSNKSSSKQKKKKQDRKSSSRKATLEDSGKLDKKKKKKKKYQNGSLSLLHGEDSSSPNHLDCSSSSRGFGEPQDGSSASLFASEYNFFKEGDTLANDSSSSYVLRSHHYQDSASSFNKKLPPRLASSPRDDTPSRRRMRRLADSKLPTRPTLYGSSPNLTHSPNRSNHFLLSYACPLHKSVSNFSSSHEGQATSNTNVPDSPLQFPAFLEAARRSREQESSPIFTLSPSVTTSSLDEEEEEADVLGAAELSAPLLVMTASEQRVAQHFASSPLVRPQRPKSSIRNLLEMSAARSDQPSEHTSSDDTQVQGNREAQVMMRRRSNGSSVLLKFSPATTEDDEASFKKSFLDDFASFAEASLGPSFDGASDILSLPEPSVASGSIFTNVTSGSSPITTQDHAMIHQLLVSYLISMGTPRQVAEDLAFSFMAQQQTNVRSQSTRGLHRLATNGTGQNDVHSQKSPHATGRVPRSITTSKLDYLQRSADENRSSRSIGARSTASAASNPAPSLNLFMSSSAVRQGGTGDDADSEAAATAWSRPLPRPPRTYTRAETPGAVVMQGRAFGAPLRQPMSERYLATSSGDDDDLPSNAFMIEAKIVNEAPVVVADKLSIKTIFRPGPLRRLAIGGLVLLMVAVATICSLLLTRTEMKSRDDDSVILEEAPSASPTLIRDDILTAAATISGWDAVLMPDSPQNRAVSWLSTFDDFLSEEDYTTEAFVQRYVIVTFFYCTNGDGYLEEEQWLSTVLGECAWSRGITCREDISGAHVVVGIDLTRNGLTGKLPDELGRLSSLEVIRSSKNRLGGTLPNSLFDLKYLHTLDLSSNQIGGSLPSNIGNAANLADLILAENDFSYPIPSGLWDLSLLRMLDLSSNHLSGSIPLQVQNLQVLVSLNLRNNLISGTIPPALKTLQKLDFTWLDYNILSGQLPQFDEAILRRQEFTVSHNLLSGPLPRPGQNPLNVSIDQVRLAKVDLSYNLLTGTMSPVISLVPTLRYADISGNQIFGTFPNSPGWLSLEFVGASNNNFTGPVPSLWPQSLNHFDFSGNQMTGTVPEKLCAFPELRFFSLANNVLEGSIPSCLVNLQKLRSLELFSAQLTGKLPTEIGNLLDLNVFDVHDNALSGSLPTVLGQLTKLIRLHVDQNNFTDRIPSELGMLTLLQQLYLSDNRFFGTLPTSLGNLIKLQNFTLYGNLELLGSVPDSMCSIRTANLSFANIGCSLGCSCCHDFEMCY